MKTPKLDALRASKQANPRQKSQTRPPLGTHTRGHEIHLLECLQVVEENLNRQLAHSRIFALFCDRLCRKNQHDPAHPGRDELAGPQVNWACGTFHSCRPRDRLGRPTGECLDGKRPGP